MIELLLAAMLGISGASALAGAALARARTRRALAVEAAAEVPPVLGDGPFRTGTVPEAVPAREGRGVRRRRPAAHQADVMIGRTFFH